MDMQLSGQRIFGLGERNRKFELNDGKWTMWPEPRNENVYDWGNGLN